MNKYNYFINKYDLKVEKVTKKGKITIFKTPLGQFVFKNSDIQIYNYLLSRGFDYFPNIVDYNNDIIMFNYIEGIEYDIEQRAQDYIKLLSYLHTKTCYYKQTNIDEYKKIYEKLYDELMSINDYYNNLINMIETKEYMSPCEYLIARNITNIFVVINQSFKLLEDWYSIVKNYTKKRVVTLYNSINLNNMIKSIDGIYLTNFDNTYVDIPIYDLYYFYKKYYSDFDINELLNRYEHIFPLNKDEKTLLLIRIIIPEKIKINNKIEDIVYVKKFINKIFKSIELLNSKEKEDGSTHQEEDNKE